MTGKIKAEITRERIEDVFKSDEAVEYPDDVKIVGWEYDFERDVFQFVLESDQIPDTPEASYTFNSRDLKRFNNTSNNQNP